MPGDQPSQPAPVARTAPPAVSAPSAGEVVASRTQGAIDRFGLVAAYVVPAGVGVAAALAHGTAKTVLLVIAVVLGALGVLYNNREAANNKLLKGERDTARNERDQAQRAEKAALRHEADTRSKAIELAIDSVMSDLGCAAHERATLFRLRPGDPPFLVAVKRSARNPLYRDREAYKLLGINEGFLGKALRDGHVLCNDLPDPSDETAYKEAHESHGLSTRAAADLSMKARSYFGVAIEAPEVGQEFIGVLMFESLDSGMWSDLEERVPQLRERLRVSVGYLIMEFDLGEDDAGEDAREVYP